MIISTIFEPNENVALILMSVAMFVGIYGISISEFWRFQLAGSAFLVLAAAAAWFYPLVREKYEYVVWILIALSVLFLVGAIAAKKLGVEDDWKT